MVRISSSSATKINILHVRSLFFCVRLPVCKNSKMIFKGFRQRLCRQISRNGKQKQKTGCEKRVVYLYCCYFFSEILWFSLFLLRFARNEILKPSFHFLVEHMLIINASKNQILYYWSSMNSIAKNSNFSTWTSL